MKFLSGGQKSRVAFAALTFGKPHILIMVNHIILLLFNILMLILL